MTEGIRSQQTQRLYTCKVCVRELVQLFQTRKLKINASSVLPLLREMGIQIIPVSENHLKAFASLPVMPGHTDSDDRLIISQALSDHIPLICSDRKFALYRKEGLDFRFNER